MSSKNLFKIKEKNSIHHGAMEQAIQTEFYAIKLNESPKFTTWWKSVNTED